MTLADETLAIIERNWSGGVPSEVVLVNANDSTDRSGTRRKDRDRPGDLVVMAGFASGDESRSGRGTMAVTRTVTVTITGSHDGDEYGTVDDDDDFETTLDAVKQALRTERDSPPPSISPHSETWVGYTLGNETDARPQYYDNYGVAFDCTWEGHT